AAEPAELHRLCRRRACGQRRAPAVARGAGSARGLDERRARAAWSLGATADITRSEGVEARWDGVRDGPCARAARPMAVDDSAGCRPCARFFSQLSSPA